MKHIILFLITVSIFAINHKISIDARDYLQDEIDITAPIANATKNLLQADTNDTDGGGDWTVEVTQSSSLAVAVESANNFGAEKLIIIRMNKFNGTANGTETYARFTDSVEKDFAEKVQAQVVSLLGLNDRGVKDTTGDSNANMEVILHYPGFMDNTNDYSVLTSQEGIQKVAKGILFGLQEHFGLAVYDPNEIHDTTPPTITIDTPNNGQIVNTPSITVSGTVVDDVAVSLVKINDTEVTLNGNSFSKEITLTEGNNTIRVYAEDSSQNNAEKIVNVVYEVTDTTGPSIIVAYPSANSTVAMQNIEIKGRVIDDRSGVKYFKIDGGNVSLGDNGNFSYPVVLTGGLNTFELKASDNEDNITTQELKVTYQQSATDTTPPVISVINPSDNQTVNTQIISVQGSVFDESSINLFTINGRNVSLNDNNEFNFDLTLSEGENQIKIYARDEFNNQSSKNLTVIYNPDAEDTTPPVINITSHTNLQKVNDSNITLLGEINDSSPINSFKINSSVVPLSNDNKFSYSAILTIGENKFEFEAIDSNNNRAVKTLILYLESHQNSGPEIIVISPKDGETIRQDNVTVKGTVRDSDGVEYLSLNNSLVSINSDGTFSINYPLNLGNNELVLSAEDKAGNKSEVRLTVVYVKSAKVESSDDGCSFSQNGITYSNLIFILLLLLFFVYKKKKWLKIKN